MGVDTRDAMKPSTLKKGGSLCLACVIPETAELVSCRALEVVAFH